jgi:signal transduction histidine kinase
MLADTDRLHYLINNLLMAARLEQRRKNSERRLTDLTQLIGERVERERVTLPLGGCISFEAEPALKAMVDPEEMGMVIRNLFENAVLYSPQSPDILVKLVKNGAWLHLSVQDHGRGLERTELKNVFERFYRVLPPGDNVRGTGLGLYIVESVIKGYGGTVGITSDGLGRGCTFTVKIPAT